MRDRQDAVRNVSEGIHFRGARANGSEPSPMVKPPDIMILKDKNEHSFTSRIHDHSYKDFTELFVFFIGFLTETSFPLALLAKGIFLRKC